MRLSVLEFVSVLVVLVLRGRGRGAGLAQALSQQDGPDGNLVGDLDLRLARPRVLLLHSGRRRGRGHALRRRQLIHRGRERHRAAK